MQTNNELLHISMITNLLVVSIIMALIIPGYIHDVNAVAGSYVETITFHKQPDPIIATDNLIAGNIDIYYETISGLNTQKILDAGHDLYTTPGGIVYSILANPTNNHTAGFNPFAYQDVRFAVNYMVDRSFITNNLLGLGSPMHSVLPPQHIDYPLVYRNHDFKYDLEEANSLISAALVPAGAVKFNDVWYYDNEPISITVFVRDDDHMRLQIGNHLINSLENVGFVVDVIHGDLSSAISTVYAADPAAQEWHLYTEAWEYYGAESNDTYATFYSPQSCNLPGWCEEDFWNYENNHIDYLAAFIQSELASSPEERAEFVIEVNNVGVSESVRVFLATTHSSFAAKSGITNLINVLGEGIATRYTPLTVQLPDNDTSLDIGVRHIAQGSWNPIGGFVDGYSKRVLFLLEDRAFAKNPHTMKLHDLRNVIVSVDTAGPDNKVDIPTSAIMWNSKMNIWDVPDSTKSTSKVTLDLKFANWHHGQPMDINDILYLVAFNEEYKIMNSDKDDPYVTEINEHLLAVNVIDDDTIEMYVDYWHHDDLQIANNASIWPTVPWEIHHAMYTLVQAGESDWHVATANTHSGNWLDMINQDDVNMIRNNIEEFKNSDHIPDFLYNNKNSNYVNDRYDASILWITDKGHAVISNGPFYLSNSIMRDSDTGDITSTTLNQFDDPTYPFAPDTWDEFINYDSLTGNITIGSLASDSGNAFRYGAEIRASHDLAVLHFNEYLKLRGENWSIQTFNLDTETNPNVALSHLMTLNEMNYKIVNGPSIDLITQDMINYADNNDMILLSCCSSIPSLATNDSLFRLLSDQTLHAKSLVKLIEKEDIEYIIPVGIDSAWALELLTTTKTYFENAGGKSDDIILYQIPGIETPDDPSDDVILNPTPSMRKAANNLATQVQHVMTQNIPAEKIAGRYMGYGEGPAFLKASLLYDILHDVRWFGADQNTASPNVDDSYLASFFANEVRFTVVQPTITLYGNMITGDIHQHLIANNISPSPYSNYAYDSVWVLGLSILNAQSIDPIDVKSQIMPTAMSYVGAIGSTTLNDNGDRIDTRYLSWLFKDGQWIEYSSDNVK